MTGLNLTQKFSVAAALIASSFPTGFRDSELSATAPTAAAAVAPVEPGIITRLFVDDAPEEISEQVNFEQLSEGQKTTLCELYLGSNEVQRDLIVKILARTNTTSDKTVLLDTDKDGKTLLANMCSFFAQEFHSQLSEQETAIKTSTLSEIADPDELNQGSYGTCATSVLVFMYQEKPAEICRILGALCSVEGETTTETGAKIFTPRFAYKEDTRSGRSNSERLIMAACMELANGNDHSYCNQCDSNYHNESGQMYSGLYDHDIRRLMKALTGKDVTVRSRESHGPDRMVESIKQDLAAGKKVFLSLRWSYGSSSSKSHLRHILPDHELEEGESHTRAVSRASSPRSAWGYHQVMALEIKNETVRARTIEGYLIDFEEPWLHYRNLHRLRSYEPGTELSNPRRRIIDRDGTEAQPLYQIKDRINRSYTFDPD